jgi:hypothetical protein
MAIFVQLVSVLKADIDSNRARINEINKLADMLRASMANGVCVCAIRVCSHRRAQVVNWA